MTITNYSPKHRTAFLQLLVPYFTEVSADIPVDVIGGKLIELIERQAFSAVIHVEIALESDIPVGFSVYQIDNVASDWCKRPGWGFIREFYISPHFRRNGFGAELERHCVSRLRKMGAQRLYLTSDQSSVGFWLACGWKKSGEFCSNDLPILEK